GHRVLRPLGVLGRSHRDSRDDPLHVCDTPKWISFYTTRWDATCSLFPRVRYTLRGTSYLSHRIGWSVQVPAHRAVERAEQAVAAWRREAWPAGKR
ncbi:helix-turn-helix domain-containing protein, partial [Planosporangium sp. 12N6]|uniref:helix-turn-helix domain-containing protein n=1 Tax=Planosporangium spinosum TaxID=3402278 RepID=UPI003CF3E7DD